MECWQCGRPAQASCRFCGRGVCKEHAKELPFILSIFTSKEDVKKAIVVPDAVYCGVCNPKDEPVELRDIQ